MTVRFLALRSSCHHGITVEAAETRCLLCCLNQSGAPTPSDHHPRTVFSPGFRDIVCGCFVYVWFRGWLTKSSPEFYDPILEHHRVKGTGMEHGDLWLLDDSAVNLEVSGRGRVVKRQYSPVACLAFGL